MHKGQVPQASDPKCHMHAGMEAAFLQYACIFNGMPVSALNAPVRRRTLHMGGGGLHSQLHAFGAQTHRHSNTSITFAHLNTQKCTQRCTQ